MSAVDIVIVLILLWGAHSGWKAGFMKEVFSVCGFAVGLLIAVLAYKLFGEHLCPALGSHSTLSFCLYMFAFVALWVIVPVLLGTWAVKMGSRIKDPFEGWVCKLTGALVGLVKYYVLISFVFSAMAYVGVINQQKKSESLFYKYVSVLGDAVFQEKTILEESGELDEKTVIIKFDRKDSLHIDAPK